MNAAKRILSLTLSQKRRIFLALDVGLVPLALLAASAIDRGEVFTPSGFAESFPLVVVLAVAATGLSVGLNIQSIRLRELSSKTLFRLAYFAGSVSVTSFALDLVVEGAVRPEHHLIFGLVYFGMLCLARALLLQILLMAYRRSDAVRRVLVYGAGNAGIVVVSALRRRADVIPVAFIDDSPALQQIEVAGLPVLSEANAERAIRLERIDTVIIASPTVSHLRRTLLARRLLDLGVRVLSLPAYWGILSDSGIADPLEPFGPRILLDQHQIDLEREHSLRAYCGATVLISGAGGSIGIELCRQVIALNPGRIVLLDISEFALYEAARECRALVDGTSIEVVAVLGSAADRRLVERALRRNEVDIVLHAAAYKHVPLLEENAMAGLSNNILGTHVLAQSSRDCGVGRFVLISSDKALCPMNTMGASKRVAELIVQNLARKEGGTVYSTVRFGNVLGSSGSVLPLFQEQIDRGGPITVTDPDATRYFMTVEEAASLVLVAASLAKGGEVFALDMGRPITVRELARRMAALSGLVLQDAENPDGEIGMVEIGLRPGEKLHERPLISENALGTPHPKIMKSYDEGLSELETVALLRDLNDALAADDESAAIAALYRWLPEFEEQRLQSRAGTPHGRVANAS